MPRRAPANRSRSMSGRGLPIFLQPLFWEYDFRRLKWDRDQYLITGRILVAGGSKAVRWLRSRIGDDGLRDWFRVSHGRELSRRQLRYWEVLLDLPKWE